MTKLSDIDEDEFARLLGTADNTIRFYLRITTPADRPDGAVERLSKLMNAVESEYYGINEELDEHRYES